MAAKDPFSTNKIIVHNGGTVETEGGTDIITVSAAGTPSIKANIEDSLAQGSIYVGDSDGVSSELAVGTTGQILTSNGTTVSYNSVSGDATLAANGALTIANDAVTNAKLADDAVSLENLDAAITPSHITVFAGEVTWSGGGATLAHTVTGALETDIVVASFHTLGTEGTILQGAYVSAADTITFTLDAANTSNDAVISYQVLRAAA